MTFTLPTGAPASTAAITISFPPSFFIATSGAVPTMSCTGGTGTAGNVVINSNNFVITTTSTAWDNAQKVCKFDTLTTGVPTAGATLVTVSSTNDNPSTAIASGPLGGQVTAASMTVTQKVPLQSGTVTVTFTTATALASGQKITVNFPASYFGAAVPSGSSIACNPACSAATITGVTGAGNSGQFQLTTGGATAPAGTITLILAGVANAGPTMPSCTVVSVLTTNDIESVQTTGAPQLGGQVTGVTFAMTAAQRGANVAAATATYFGTMCRVRAGTSCFWR